MHSIEYTNICMYVYSEAITTHQARNIYIHTDCKYAYTHIHARTRTTISHVNRYMYVCINIHVCTHIYIYKTLIHTTILESQHEHPGDARGGGLGSSTIFKKFNEPYAPS